MLATTALALPGSGVVLGWLLAASGMGLLYPRVTAAVLARTARRDRGSTSSAITLSDAIGAATSVALAGIVFTAVGTAADRSAFVAVFALTCAVGLLGAAVARRA